MTRDHSKAIRTAQAKAIPWTRVGRDIIRADIGGLLHAPWFRLTPYIQLVQWAGIRPIRHGRVFVVIDE